MLIEEQVASNDFELGLLKALSNTHFSHAVRSNENKWLLSVL